MVGPGGLGPCTGGPGAAPRHGPPGAGGPRARPARPGELELEGGGRAEGAGARARVRQQGACKGGVRGGGDKENETLDETKDKNIPKVGT